MDDVQLYEYIRHLLQGTFSSMYLDTDQIRQNEAELKELSQSDERFSEIICNIALNDNDKSIIKAAIIQIKNFSPEIILNFIILFNEQLNYPDLHQMIFSLSDLLSKQYMHNLYNFCIDFNEQIDENDFTENGIINKRTLMMAILSFLNNFDEEFSQSDLYAQFEQIFVCSLPQNTQFISQIIQSNELNPSEQHALFFHYFIQVFKKFFFSHEDQNTEFLIFGHFEFIHLFLCFSLQNNIDYLFPDLETKIVSSLFMIYSVYFDENDENFLDSIQFDEILNSYDIFNQKASLSKMPLSFLITIKSFFQCSFVYEKYIDLVEPIIEFFIFPLFSYNISNITDDVEFISLYYPNISTENLQSYAMYIIGLSFGNIYLTETLYNFAYRVLPEYIENEKEEDIFAIINMMSYCCNSICQYQAECLSNFCNYINDNLLDTECSLVNISIMHYISQLPRNFDSFPKIFLHFTLLGLSGQLSASDEYINYNNIILYFSIVAYSNFLDFEPCPFPVIDQNLLHEILVVTINFNDYFKTDEISTALCVFIEHLTKIDDKMLADLTEVIFKLYIQEPDNTYSVPNYIHSLMSLFKICEQQVNAANKILDFFDEFLQTSQNSDNDKQIVSVSLIRFNDEILSCVLLIIDFLLKILPENEFNTLFGEILELFGNILSLINLIDVDWEIADKILMCFINLRDQIDFNQLLSFFENIINLIVECDFIPFKFYSISAFLMNFIKYPEVQEFRQKYQDVIDHIIALQEQIEEEEEEEAFDEYQVDAIDQN